MTKWCCTARLSKCNVATCAWFQIITYPRAALWSFKGLMRMAVPWSVCLHASSFCFSASSGNFRKAVVSGMQKVECISVKVSVSCYTFFTPAAISTGLCSDSCWRWKCQGFWCVCVFESFLDCSQKLAEEWPAPACLSSPGRLRKMSLSKAKLQKLELTMTASTRAPSTLDEMDSDKEDNLSQCSGSAMTSGKRSKAKPQHMRNANAQAKNLRKAFVHMQLMTREEADAMSVEEVLSFRKMHHENRSRTSQLKDTKLEVLNAQKANMLTEMVSFKWWLQAEMKDSIKPQERAEFQKKFLVKTAFGQGYVCQLCSKESWGGPGCKHLESAAHFEKETEEILMDRLFGTASQARRFGGGCHVPTREAVRNYWGPNVENLITILETKIQSGEEIRFKYGRSQRAASYVINKEKPYRFHLALICYNETTGNYKNSTFYLDSVRLWNNIPEIEDEDVAKLYQKNQKKGDKWWPVVICQVGDDRSEAFQEIDPDWIYVIICKYQILQKDMTAWCVNFIKRATAAAAVTSRIKAGVLGRQEDQTDQDLQDQHMKGPGEAARPSIDVRLYWWYHRYW